MKQAYYSRMNHRYSWKKIADELGYSSPGAARTAALKFQSIYKLPNLPMRKTLGEEAFNLKVEGLSVLAIAEKLNYHPGRNKTERKIGIRSLINIYCQKNNLEYPYPKR